MEPPRRDLRNDFRWSEAEVPPSRPWSWRHACARLVEAVADATAELVFGLFACGLFLLMIAGVVALTGAPVGSSWVDALMFNWQQEPVATVGAGAVVLVFLGFGVWSLRHGGDLPVRRLASIAALGSLFVGAWLSYVITSCLCS